MRAIAKIPTKYSESVTVLTDPLRHEVVLRDAEGHVHRLTPDRAAEFEAAINAARCDLRASL